MEAIHRRIDPERCPGVPNPALRSRCVRWLELAVTTTIQQVSETFDEDPHYNTGLLARVSIVGAKMAGRSSLSTTRG